MKTRSKRPAAKKSSASARLDELEAFRSHVETMFPELKSPAAQRRMAARAPGQAEEAPGPFDHQSALDRIKR